MTVAGLEVVVTSGTGQGPTDLAAFDAALNNAGVAHFNLIRLSSLIPSGSRVFAGSVAQPPRDKRGDRLYAVYAEHRQSVTGHTALAGLGWAQDDTGAGLLVEYCGEDQAHAEAYINMTLDNMKTRRPGSYGENQWRTASIDCDVLPVVAVVIAAFRVESW